MTFGINCERDTIYDKWCVHLIFAKLKLRKKTSKETASPCEKR